MTPFHQFYDVIASEMLEAGGNSHSTDDGGHGRGDALRKALRMAIGKLLILTLKEVSLKYIRRL